MSEYLPVIQSLHVLLVAAPVVSEYVPLGQARQVLLLVDPVPFECVPAGHKEHDETLIESENDPGGQIEH